MRAILNALGCREPRVEREPRWRAYTVAQARALHALAESQPTPEAFARERERILAS